MPGILLPSTPYANQIICYYKIDPMITQTETQPHLTVGYIDDEFLIATDNGSNRFYYAGETAGAMISGKGANLMFAYGNADANGDDGEIRSLAGDMALQMQMAVTMK